jgi:hypothetical protein
LEGCSRAMNVFLVRIKLIPSHQRITPPESIVVYLDPPIYGKVTLHLPGIVHIKASVHNTVTKSIEEIPVVQEFPDVFPDDLPGMPGTAPITKSPYKLT